VVAPELVKTMTTAMWPVAPLLLAVNDSWEKAQAWTDGPVVVEPFTAVVVVAARVLAVVVDRAGVEGDELHADMTSPVRTTARTGNHRTTERVFCWGMKPDSCATGLR